MSPSDPDAARTGPDECAHVMWLISTKPATGTYREIILPHALGCENCSGLVAGWLESD